MTSDDFAKAFAACPLVAILRGIDPSEALAVGQALERLGYTLVEVPLNSPDPLRSIEILRKGLGPNVLVGAGTVIRPEQVRDVASAGGQLIVSPNTDAEVIGDSVAQGLISLPGCQTPSEAFLAIKSGAHALKFFPAEALEPKVLRAMGAVIPKDVPKLVVGGITPDNMGDWLAEGAAGFGLGSALYRPGNSAQDVATNGVAYLESLARHRSAISG